MIKTYMIAKRYALSGSRIEISTAAGELCWQVKGRLLVFLRQRFTVVDADDAVVAAIRQEDALAPQNYTVAEGDNDIGFVMQPGLWPTYHLLFQAYDAPVQINIGHGFKTTFPLVMEDRTFATAYLCGMKWQLELPEESLAPYPLLIGLAAVYSDYMGMG